MHAAEQRQHQMKDNLMDLQYLLFRRLSELA